MGAGLVPSTSLDTAGVGSTLGSRALFLRRNSSSGMRLSSVFSFLEAGSSSMGGGGWTGGMGAGAGTGATGGAGTKAVGQERAAT